MKIYLGSKKLNDVTILDQCIKLNHKFANSDLFKLAVKYGGYSIIGDIVIVNYSEFEKLNIYDNNDVRLILPPEVDTQRVSHIIKALEILKVNNPVAKKFVGGWVNKQGELIEEENTLIEFNSGYSDLKWHFIHCLMKDIKIEFSQESTAIMFNDALILI